MAQAAIEVPGGSYRAPRPSGHRFFILFVFLLASLIFYPYAQTNQALYVSFRVVGNCAILLSIYAVGVRRGLAAVALLLAIPAFIHHNRWYPDASVLTILNIALSFTFDVFVIVVIFRRVFDQTRATSETIFGALCIYLLLGFGFASIYGAITLIQANAFYLDPVMNLHTVPDRFDFIYYSFATMTSLGTNGFAAVSPQARSLTVIEAVLGVLYLAVLIARLMSAYRPRVSE